MRLLLVLFASCHIAATGDCRVTVTVPPGVSLSREEMAAELPRTIVTGHGCDEAEIVVYHFSRGVERLRFNEGGVFEESLSPGRIECLVKLKRNQRLVKALFISAEGANTSLVLGNFSRALSDALRKR